MPHLVFVITSPAVTLFFLVILPEEDDGTAQAIHNKATIEIAAQMLKTRPINQYYLRSCPAVVPASVSNLVRVISNGTAHTDAIIPGIITAFCPLSGYFLQVLQSS
jgi:hypothetical protein